MKNEIQLKAEKALYNALRETRNAAIDELTNAVWKKYDAYEKLLTSQEAIEILIHSYGEKLNALYDTRRNLRNKMDVLQSIATMFHDIKWKKQQRREN